mgnify:CR=1 FL=1
MGEKLFTAKEAAEILKVRKNTVYDMIKRGDLKASKLGKQLRIRQEDLDFYIQYGSQAKVVNSMQTGQSSNIDKVESERNASKTLNILNEMSGVNRKSKIKNVYSKSNKKQIQMYIKTKSANRT